MQTHACQCLLDDVRRRRILERPLPMKFFCAILPRLTAAMIFSEFILPAQTLSVLYNFTNSQSSVPLGAEVLAGGKLYGTAAHGGSNDQGIVYAVNADATGFTIIHDFSNDANGGAPEGGLVCAGDTLYGTTALGGTNGPWGTVFSVKTNGSDFRLLYSFTGDPTIGQHPHPRLMLSGSTLYGAASGQASPGWGTLFSIQADGTGFTPLYTFSTPHAMPRHQRSRRSMVRVCTSSAWVCCFNCAVRCSKASNRSRTLSMLSM